MEFSPEVQEKLNSSLIELLDSMVNAKNFAVDQMPEVVEELLRWKAMESMIGWSFCVLMLLFSMSIFVFVMYRMFSWKTMEREKISKFSHDFHICCAIASGICFFIFAIVFSEWDSATLDWLQISIAPKAYIVDYIMGLKQ